jgi:hypothetical protein
VSVPNTRAPSITPKELPDEFLDAALRERLDVMIEYTEATLKLEMQGRVAWCSEKDEVEATKSAGRYVVGIELFSPFLFMSMADLY